MIPSTLATKIDTLATTTTHEGWIVTLGQYYNAVMDIARDLEPGAAPKSFDEGPELQIYVAWGIRGRYFEMVFGKTHIFEWVP